MPAKLSPEERERRRKERSKRSFSDAAYKHYDPKTEGFGSSEDWKGTVNARLNTTPVIEVNADLLLLNLTIMPKTAQDLHRAYRLASRTAHPDTDTGSDAAFRAMTEAYDRLKSKVK